MAVTDTHVAALRSMLTGNEGEYERHAAELERTGDKEGYVTLIRHTFQDAVVRQFSRGSTWRPAEVAGYVASLRSRWVEEEADFDPNLAERLIRAELGDGETAPLNTDTLRTLIILVTGLILDEDHDEDGIAEVVAKARERANAQPS